MGCAWFGRGNQRGIGGEKVAQRVDVAPREVIVEISGQEKKIEAFIDLMRPFGIVELVRTGRIAMVRGGKSHDEQPTAVDDIHVEDEAVIRESLA